MPKGERKNRDYLSRRSLLLAIGEAGVAASVLDPDPTLLTTQPKQRPCHNDYGLNDSRNGFQEGHRRPGEDREPGFTTPERVREARLTEGREEDVTRGLDMSCYDHAA